MENKVIHYTQWANSHLSIAKHYGGIEVNGKKYTMDTKSCKQCMESLGAKETEDKYFPDLILIEKRKKKKSSQEAMV